MTIDGFGRLFLRLISSKKTHITSSDAQAASFFLQMRRREHLVLPCHIGSFFPDISEKDRKGGMKMLNQREKKFVVAEVGWSKPIVDAINTLDEYHIYKRLGLKEVTIDGRPCLVPSGTPDNISLSRMREGKAWLDTAGKPMELHHVGGLMSSPYAVLPRDFHRGKGYFSILHPNFWMKKSAIDRKKFGPQRRAFWKAYAKLF